MILAAAPAGHRALYDALVALHVASGVIGFGAVAVSGAYGPTARRAGSGEAGEEAARYFARRGRAEWLVLAVPFLGAGALALRPGRAAWADVWVLGAAGVWLVAAAILLGVVRPAEAAVAAGLRGDRPPAKAPRTRSGGPAAGAPGPRPARAGTPRPGVASAAARLTWGAAACDVLFVVALALMVAQPA